MSVIRFGDKVEVWFVSGTTKTLCSQSVKATVLKMPEGEGDLLQLKYEDGRVEAINPCNQLFFSISRSVVPEDGSREQDGVSGERGVY